MVTDNVPLNLHSQHPTSLFCLWRRVQANCDVSAHLLKVVTCFSLSIPLSETAQSRDIHALRGSSFAMTLVHSREHISRVSLEHSVQSMQFQGVAEERLVSWFGVALPGVRAHRSFVCNLRVANALPLSQVGTRVDEACHQRVRSLGDLHAAGMEVWCRHDTDGTSFIRATIGCAIGLKCGLGRPSDNMFGTHALA